MDNSQPPVTEELTGHAGEMPAEFPGAGAPPTTPAALPSLAAKTTWPTVMGIIAIIFGGFGALGSLSQIVSPFMMEMVGANTSAQAEQEAVFEAIGNWKYYMAFVGVGSLVLSVMLFICGLKLLKRSRSVSALLLKWSIGKMVWSVIVIIITFGMQSEQFAAMSETNQGMSQAITGVVAILSAIFGLLFAWAFPIFTLIWMRRATIVAEVQQWD